MIPHACDRIWNRHKLDLWLIAGLMVVGIGWWMSPDADAPYQWRWSALFQYLVRFDAGSGGWQVNWLLKGMFTTIRLSVWALIVAIGLGILVALTRLSASMFNRMLGWGYVTVNRNLPPLVLIVVFYYFVSSQLFPLLPIDAWLGQLGPAPTSVLEWAFGPVDRLEPMLSAIVTLALFEGAYMAEIIRAGVLSVPLGHWEAGAALGIPTTGLYRHIILPQATRRMLPPLAGQAVSTIKDSAIVSIISIPELTFQGNELMSATYMTYEIWIAIAVMYLMLTIPVSTGAYWLESRLRDRLGDGPGSIE